MRAVMVSRQLFILIFLMCHSVSHLAEELVPVDQQQQQPPPPPQPYRLDSHHQPSVLAASSLPPPPQASSAASPAAAGAAASSASQQPKVYTNQFVLQIDGGPAEARELASKHGFVYLDHIFGDYYHLQHRRIAKRSTSSDSIAKMNISIEEEPQVISLKQQVLKRRVKRDLIDLGPAPTVPRGSPPPGRPQRPQTHTPSRHPHHGRVMHPIGHRPPPLLEPMLSEGHASHLEATPNGHHNHQPAVVVGMEAGELGMSASNLHPVPAPTSPSGLRLGVAPSASNSLASSNITGGGEGGGGGVSPAAASSLHYQHQFNDPSWSQMWYLEGGAKNGFDLNVMAAWNMGYTGKGVVITILDDGLEKDHPDLAANYDPKASFDINGDDPDPMPRYDMADSNRHGTRCAGEVAAVSDNNICSVGIAFNSKVGGVRMLDGDVTDAVEARSLSLNQQHIHIYSASWGPDDNGKTVDGPGELATHAFMEGVTNGRQGLGSIFVFASGNGGREYDNCNCDGYTNSIWTLSISSATENGLVPWYSEACSSTLATTYSSGSYDERQIITTDLHHSCTSSHTGTSASAPLAAGICALVLEANPKLTWRDMQHIVVRTAKVANLVAKDWRTNSLGRNVSHSFGYGLMDAAAMIHLAKRWNTVPIQYMCEVRSPTMDKAIPSKGYIELKLQATCNNINYLEHVQSKITLSSNRRGDLHIYLVSPHGTRSTLLAQRPHDTAKQGFRNWPFMTVHSWGEHPNGEWTLEVHNEGKTQSRAHLKEWTLILYGTDVDVNAHHHSHQHPNQPPKQHPNQHLHQPNQQPQPHHHQHQQHQPMVPPTTQAPPPTSGLNHQHQQSLSTQSPGSSAPVTSGFPTLDVTIAPPIMIRPTQQQAARPTVMPGKPALVVSPNTDRYQPRPQPSSQPSMNTMRPKLNNQPASTTATSATPTTPTTPTTTTTTTTQTTQTTKTTTMVMSTLGGDNITISDLPGGGTITTNQQQQDLSNHRQMAPPKPTIDAPLGDNKIDIVKAPPATTPIGTTTDKGTTAPPLAGDEFGNNGLDTNQITASTSASKDYRSSGSGQLQEPRSGAQTVSAHHPLAMLLVSMMVSQLVLLVLTRELVLWGQPLPG